MAIDRRAFLKLGLAGLLCRPGRLFALPGQRLLGCHSDGRGGHFASVVDGRGQVLSRVPLPGRGHGAAVNPAATEAVVFARRPGTFLCVLDLVGGGLARQIESAPDRHFYGHGVFDAAGTRLFTTENDFATGQGRIGVYAADDGYRRLGELPSHGVGPHELHLLGDGRTLVIANGGIRTHPDLPRAKLNLDEMDPNLAYVDGRDGRLLDAYRPPRRWHRLSIRHLDVAPDDRVAVAMQYEGPVDRYPPLIALHRGETELQLLRAPEPIQERMHNYCGSAAFAPDGGSFAVSSPRGGLVTYWSAAGEYLGRHEQRDACGLAGGADGYWASDGTGWIYQEAPQDGEVERLGAWAFEGYRWDNHLVLL